MGRGRCGLLCMHVRVEEVGRELGEHGERRNENRGQRAAPCVRWHAIGLILRGDFRKEKERDPSPKDGQDRFLPSCFFLQSGYEPSKKLEWGREDKILFESLVAGGRARDTEDVSLLPHSHAF